MMVNDGEWWLIITSWWWLEPRNFHDFPETVGNFHLKSQLTNSLHHFSEGLKLPPTTCRGRNALGKPWKMITPRYIPYWDPAEGETWCINISTYINDRFSCANFFYIYINVYRMVYLRVLPASKSGSPKNGSGDPRVPSWVQKFLGLADIY